MPKYDYEHAGKGCSLGKVFEHEQPISQDALKRCPKCGAEVRRIITSVNIATPRTNSELKDLGFTKLVRRDKGVYENVTAREGDKKIWEAGEAAPPPPSVKKK